MDEETANASHKIIKERVGCRRGMAKEIARCVGMGKDMIEVARILPTLEGAIIYILFYSCSHEEDDRWFHFRRASDLNEPLLSVSASASSESHDAPLETSLDGEELRVFTLLSKCVRGRGLHVAIQSAFGLPELPRNVAFSLAQSKISNLVMGEGKASLASLQMGDVAKA